MRPIKFRAWDKKEKKMYFADSSFEVNTCFYIYDDGNSWELVAPEDKVLVSELNGELMQFTGLKDKNGKEIYEGDIVEHKSKYNHVKGKFKVKYVSEARRLRVTYESKEKFAAFCLFRIGRFTKRYKGDEGWEGVVGSQEHLSKDLEVIGNIFSNPELLKK